MAFILAYVTLVRVVKVQFASLYNPTQHPQKINKQTKPHMKPVNIMYQLRDQVLEQTCGPPSNSTVLTPSSSITQKLLIEKEAS